MSNRLVAADPPNHTSQTFPGIFRSVQIMLSQSTKMASQNPNQKFSLYPNPNSWKNSDLSSNSSNNLYPTLDMRDLVENVFPDTPQRAAGYHDDHRDAFSPSAPPLATEEVILKIPGAILHLIDRSYSVELGCGDFEIVTLIQGENVVAVLARVANEIQWPLVKDGTAVKLDDSHYFFSIRPPKAWHSSDTEDEKSNTNVGSLPDQDLLNYGLTFASKGQEGRLREVDRVLKKYTCFSVQKVAANGEEVLEGAAEAAKEMSPADLGSERKREMMEDRSTAYWTTLAPNVEEYSGTTARFIASGSGKMIKGILWCGDVTTERLKRGNDVLKKRVSPGEKEAEISPQTLKRIKRVKKVTQRTEKVANGVLTGVVKVSGFFSRSIGNSKTGQKVIRLLPEEIILASLDGFDRICDAVEVAGKNVMSTSSTVTSELVSHRYGDQASEATQEGLDAAGHAVGVAWAAFKIRRALNLKSALKPSQISKSALKAAVAEKMGKGEKTGKSGK